MNNYQYQAIFTNSIGPATAGPATLTVQFAPAVSASPTNQIVDAGGSAAFTASETDGNPAATVQWQISTDGGATFHNLSNAAPYSNVTTLTGGTATLNIAAATASLNGDRYRAVFSNAVGPATTASAALTVDFAPAVVTSPTNQIVSPGGTANFAATEMNGNPAATTVQWQISTDGARPSKI